MRDTEAPDCPNLSWEINPGKFLVIAFAGMARGLNELANFEFVKTTEEMDCSKIFCRDEIRSFYHEGISEEITTIPSTVVRLKKLIEEMSPSRITCIGVSAGGYAALVFAHLLGADTAHAFGPQTMLHKQWGLDHTDPTIIGCETLHNAELSPENDFRDLSTVLENYNGKTKYYIHIGKDCEQDLNHARRVENSPGVEIVFYDGHSHACAAHILRGQNRLGKVITS